MTKKNEAPPNLRQFYSLYTIGHNARLYVISVIKYKILLNNNNINTIYNVLYYIINIITNNIVYPPL